MIFRDEDDNLDEICENNIYIHFGIFYIFISLWGGAGGGGDAFFISFQGHALAWFKEDNLITCQLKSYRRFYI